MEARGGFTLVESLIAISIAAILMMIGASAYKTYNEATIVRQSANLVAADIAVTRSAAIKLRENVSLVADESGKRYVIRTTSGDTLRAPRTFDADSDLPLLTFDVALSGDSLTFDSRGLLTSTGTGSIDLARRDRTLRVEFNALGRHRIVKP